jgi:hypothetical protein
MKRKAALQNNKAQKWLKIGKDGCFIGYGAVLCRDRPNRPA